MDQWHLPSFFTDDEAIHGSTYKRPCELAVDEWESYESSDVVTIQGNAQQVYSSWWIFSTYFNKCVSCKVQIYLKPVFSWKKDMLNLHQ